MESVEEKVPKNAKVPAFVYLRKRMLNEKQIEHLRSLNGDEITKVTILELFSRKAHKIEEDGGIRYEVDEPYMYPSNEFILPANSLPNQKETVLTTAGLYILNIHVIIPAFEDLIPYVNVTLDKKEKEKLVETISNLVLNKKISTEQFALYQDRLTRLASCSGFLVESMSAGLITPFPAVEKAKKELFEKYKDEINNNNITLYLNKIEKKLLEIAKNELKYDKSYTVFKKGGKPDFNNNYAKNMVCVGGMVDPVTGEYVIVKNSYNNGPDLKNYHVSCNKLIYGSYNRGVKTQYGGSLTKYLYRLMHAVVAAPDGSDCGSELYREVVLTKENKNNYRYRYIYEGKKDKNGKKLYTCLNDDIINDYIGKKVKLRSPMYCKQKGNEICNICLGDLYKKLEIKNIGLTSTRASASVMYVSMKAMHDVSIKDKAIDIFKFIKKVKK